MSLFRFLFPSELKMIWQPHPINSGERSPSSDREAIDLRRRRSLVVALGGDALAENAVPHAVELARRWNIPVRLVQVVSPIQRKDGSELGLMANREFETIWEQADAYLEGVAETINAQSGVPVTAQTVIGLAVEDALVEASREDAALMIMAKGRRGSFSQLVFGSVTNRLVGRLRIPLLLVPVAARGVPPLAADYRRILVGVGPGEEYKNVLGAAAALWLDDDECHLLHVRPPAAASLTVRGRSGRSLPLQEDAWLHVLKAREWLEDRGVRVASHLVDHSYSPAKALLAHGRSLAADLVVLGTRPHVLPWWLRRGVPEYVVRHAPCPVLLVPAASTLPGMLRTSHMDVYAS